MSEFPLPNWVKVDAWALQMRAEGTNSANRAIIVSPSTDSATDSCCMARSESVAKLLEFVVSRIWNP